jgi:cob(I)alamin adenosyltransferase
MKLTGSVAFRDVESGVWVLEGDDGHTYELAGGDRGIKKNGRRVEVEGDVDSQAISIGMVGPILRVTRYRFL